MNPYQYMIYLVFGPITAFVYAYYAIAITLKQKTDDMKIAKVLAWIFVGIPFLIVDIAYNLIVGTIIFFEFPREFLFTSRLTRQKENGNILAYHLCEILNIFDEGHC